MALYIDEEEVWKCPKHPSRRRRTGICHVCLRERLSSLCPDCASVRPCGCYATTTSSSNSSSASFSRIGTVARVSNLIDSEPAFRRSRSVAVPFFRSKPSVDHDHSPRKDSPKTASFWSRFKSGSRSKRDVGLNVAAAVVEQGDNNDHNDNSEEQRRKVMMRKSRSVAVDVKSSSKGKGWYFPSPIKAFRQSISRGVMVQERSPLYRG
ncbi:uncharacterized protein LOC8289092 [Ricinus communis]|uniref:Uncharacterized protein n=1 Tax=Ricinus communis TaxID=3988 RepID=B9SNV4_RICCO|nr:uncharacterized protein LOC8289092 [Ricinus communis]EEF34744.1 conserved hypothetical protein [Ricinus communis]|eukprot:XP_002527673.1 uncharacterized protein LOC8289092 [Ricinus communis]